jgi:serine/threonine protein kinase
VGNGGKSHCYLKIILTIKISIKDIPMGDRPVEKLAGIKLRDGWIVLDLFNPPPGSTGGFFSVGYIVKRPEDGKEAYLKALDFSGALKSPDPARVLQSLTEAYNFERDLLAKCKKHKMSRVLTAIADGVAEVPGFGDLSRVHYLIFEKAEGDIRQHFNLLAEFDTALCLRSLHHIAVGLNQLHSKGIAHQDLKPSNVLIFPGKEHKISDLGQAFDRSIKKDLDLARVPGDPSYAPIEQFYDYKLPDDMQRRFAADLYLLGSLFFFYFLNISVTNAIRTKLNVQHNLNFTNKRSHFAGRVLTLPLTKGC